MIKSIINSYKLIIAFLMIVLNGAGASASGSWTVNPGDYQYDMTLYLKVMLADGEMDYSDYEVAVFNGDECRGIAELLPVGDSGRCLYLRARSNQASGESLYFKYCNLDSGEIHSFPNVKFDFVADSRLGYPSEPYSVDLFNTFTVSVYADTGGTVDSDGATLIEGETLTVTATPDEGYHFLRWSDGNTDNPRTIVADRDYSITAMFAPNIYTLTYLVDEELYKKYEIEYGAEIIPEPYPVKEGYSFSGWSGLPETMPAHDVSVSGYFTVNSYTATFKIGEETIESVTVNYGEEIPLPQAPEKEGHSFDGWKDVPETMPAQDLVIFGTYSVNAYTATFKIGEDTIENVTVNYGETIPLPGAPEKEGYSFDGWKDVPETMPAHDLVIFGSYSVNAYTATFKIGEDTIESVTVNYGETIPLPEAPEKEGHSFDGWQDVPETMPAQDITIYGSYTINSYTLSVYLNDELYSSEELEYGAPINIEEPEVPGMKFEGWLEEIPETMPAHDLDIHGILSQSGGITGIFPDNDTPVTVIALDGKTVCTGLRWQEVRSSLEPGLYVINGVLYLIR